MVLALLILLAQGAPAELTTRAPGAPAPSVAPPPLEGLTVRIPMNAAVKEHLAWFTGPGRAVYARWTARMGGWEAAMKPILARHGLPPELIYVCMIESGFHPDAVSRAAAVGPWQFVRSTGRVYGLRTDDWVDERRDPLKATEAAARHLGELHERFGTWSLAMAAYNAGVGSIARGIDLANSNDYWRLVAAGVIPDDATKYVPKAMAAMVIGQDPKRYGFGDVVPDPPVTWATVVVPGGVDVRALARKAKVSSAELDALNPELVRGYTPPDGGGYELRVPVGAEAAIGAAVDRVAQTKRFVEHRLRFGERLRDVARRYGSTRRELRRLNPEVGPGVALKVPKRGKPVEPAPELLVMARPEVRYEIPGRREVLFPVRLTLEQGEIAAFFDVPVGQLAMWNGLDPRARLQRGMVLRVFVPEDFDASGVLLADREQVVVVDAGSEAQQNALAHAKDDRPPAFRMRSHEVRRGESLWKIAQRYAVTVASIRAQNGLGKGDYVHPGMTLKIPQLKPPRPKGRAGRRKAKRLSRGKRRYTVKAGDTLGRIAKRFGVDLEDIRRANGIKGAAIHPGQELMIP